ncbi:MAG: UDP-N-acetylglucosamine diphosphorylase/glucosamine-1-phosphate N-acetyltransferase [Chloroflexota bacterium]|nr:MAG: UDP-N-acetylglucosamine diphosphorylase/glucosamine-1-phosphate N-acetyltransferase [Chloroflexota bacterium]
MTTIAVILAAGEGTRMCSNLPKVLHPILGKPIAQYALDAVASISDKEPILVVGHKADEVKQALPENTRYVYQAEQLGTGHAVQQAEKLLTGNTDFVLVTYADMPLLRSETLENLVETQKNNQGPLTMLTVILDDPHGFGRIIRNEDGEVQAIVEEADASPKQREVKELNAGVYCFSSAWLWKAINNLKLSPKGEYYLTDLVEAAVSEGLKVCTVSTNEPSELIGVNTRVHLAEAAKIIQERINHAWMLSGVTIADPHTTYIEPAVTIAADTVILPNTHLQGVTKIGAECVIGPNAIVRDSQIGNYCKIEASVVESAILEDHVDIGPFGHLRKGAHLAEGVHMGNFGEVKASYLGSGTKMGHFSYIGNTTTGENVNIGAGTITCNYDGSQKHKTQIGNGVFIGSDTMLVAPVTLEDEARTGAGAVVTKDVPAKTVVVGVPARALRKIESE